MRNSFPRVMIKQLAAVKHMYPQKQDLLWVMSHSQGRGLEVKGKTIIPDGKPAPFWGSTGQIPQPPAASSGLVMPVQPGPQSKKKTKLKDGLRCRLE